LKQLVSIIVPCYNQAQYLDEALQSVLGQTYTNWECIIVNDGSLDNTEQVAKNWVAKDVRYSYLYKGNGGLSSARNLGLEKVKGSYIQFLDSDDILDSRKLELSLSEFDSGKDLVISNFRMFVDKMANSTIPFCTLKLELFNFRSVLLKWETVFSIPIHCGFFHIDLFRDFRFPEELKAKEDWIMWLYLFQKEVKVSFIDQPLVYYRTHQKNMTNNASHMLNNHVKAIFHLKTLISETDYIDFLLFELEQKYTETKKLRTTINNYQNSATYRIAQKIKDVYLLKRFYNTLK
jgi:hypothetical protein